MVLAGYVNAPAGLARPLQDVLAHTQVWAIDDFATPPSDPVDMLIIRAVDAPKFTNRITRLVMKTAPTTIVIGSSQRYTTGHRAMRLTEALTTLDYGHGSFSPRHAMTVALWRLGHSTTGFSAGIDPSAHNTGQKIAEGIRQQLELMRTK